jgi:hypothetical protein
MQIVGDKGILTVDECWNYSAPVYLDRYARQRFRAERYPITKTYPFLKDFFGPLPRTYPPVKKSTWKQRNARFRQDYARGIAELARAITEQRPPRMPADYWLHVNELAFAIQNPTGSPYQVTTTFKPIEPLDDAALKELIPKKW